MVPFESWHLRWANGSLISCQISSPENPTSRHGYYCFNTVNCLAAAWLRASLAPKPVMPALRVAAVSELTQRCFCRELPWEEPVLIKLCDHSPFYFLSGHLPADSTQRAGEGSQGGSTGQQKQSPTSCLTGRPN